jgi:hypothetical protein
MARLTGLSVTLDGNTQKLSTLITNILPQEDAQVLAVTIQSRAANANTTLWGPSTMTAADSAWGEVAKGTAVTISAPQFQWFKLDNLYLKGTNGEKLYITVFL